MKRSEEFWVIDGNYWNKELFSKEKAEEIAKTLENCIDCVDCINCANCKSCDDCTGFTKNRDSSIEPEIKKLEKNEQCNDPIEPKHYTELKISPLEYITANEGEFSWCIANVIKYVSRYKRKNGYYYCFVFSNFYYNHFVMGRTVL